MFCTSVLFLRSNNSTSGISVTSPVVGLADIYDYVDHLWFKLYIVVKQGMSPEVDVQKCQETAIHASLDEWT